MPVCHYCGKQLCNEQSLRNHIESRACPKNDSRRVETLQRKKKDYDFSFMCDLKGVITHIDKKDAECLLYSPDDIIGKSGYDFIYEEDKLYMSHKHIAALVNKTSDTYAIRRVKKNEEILTVLEGWVINETLNEIFVYGKILTFENVSGINFILNKNLNFSWISKEFTNTYGYCLNDLKGVSFFSLNNLTDCTHFLVDLTTTKKEITMTFSKRCKNHDHVKVKCNATNKGNFFMISELII
tara:strand:+ start:219 stop:938 length:720 start_codon:yes stop_codon:yes gene_type:complete